MIPQTLILLAVLAAEEEAVRPDGRRTSGNLTVDAGGRLRFTPKQGAAPPSETIATIRFPAASIPANRPCYGVRVTLHDGQHLAGQLLSLDDKALSLRSAWAEKIDLPRTAVASVTHLPGWRTVAEDDLREAGKTWKIVGKPSLDAKNGGATLNERGQALAYPVAVPLEAGRVGIAFLDQDAKGARCTFEAEFGNEKRRTVRVTVAGAGEAYEVDAGGLDGVPRRVARTPGLHRLLIQFTPHSLRITIDDQVLWHNLDAGPGGPLRQVRLACDGDDKDKLQGAVVYSEFFLARAIVEPRRPPSDATQDEAWRGDGDQLFGRVLRADARTVEFDCNGKRALPWSALHGVWLRRDAPPPRTTAGAHVRLAVRTCLSTEPDRLDGVVTALDDKALSLKHALLGEVRLERARLHTLQPLFHGQRIEIDNAFHHLGDPKGFAPQLQPPRAEGSDLKRIFTLDALPDEARLVLQVVQLKGLKETASRATVYLNGERLDELNRHVDKARDEPRRLTLTLPKERLRKGDNVLELKLTASPETLRVESCGVFGLAIEVLR